MFNLYYLYILLLFLRIYKNKTPNTNIYKVIHQVCSHSFFSFNNKFIHILMFGISKYN